MAEGDASGSAGGSGRNPLVAIVLILNVIVLGAIGFFQYKIHAKISKEPSVQDVVKAQMKEVMAQVEAQQAQGEKAIFAEKKKDTGNLLNLDPITANLAQGDGPRRYVRVSAVLKFSPESKKEEYEVRTAQIRDAIISILNAKRPEDLSKSEGKTYLKQEIKASVNAFLVEGSLDDVYYTNFNIN